MQKVSELVSKSIGNTLSNIKTWNSLAYNALEYGVIEGGQVNTTEKLQELVNLAISQGRRTIILPHVTNGQYLVTSLTNADQVDFVGDNSTFVGGYSGTIGNIGGFAELKADTTQRGLNAKSAPYNAIGNDVADDTAALQAVINAAQAVNGTVILPDGTYLFTTLSISGNVTFYSPGNAVLKQMAHAGHAINITGTAKQVKFENVTLDANHSAQAANSPNVMVYADVQGDSVTKKPHVLSFVDCDFLNICFAGISYYGDNNDTTEEHLYVNRCRFIGSQQSTDPDQKFIGVNDGSHCFITECYFDSTRDAFAAAPPYNPCAIAIQNAEPVLENRKFSRIFISENIIKNMGRNNLGAIDFYVKADKVHISNNTITDCYSGGIRGKTNSKDIVITGNTIEHIGESGIILNAWTGQVSEQNCIITDNIVLNCVQYGITLNGWDADFFKNIVVANNIVETATVGIYLIKCENVNIHHNIINECVTGIQVPAHNNKYIIIDANTLKCSTVQLNGIYIDDTTLTMYAEKITITNNIIFNYRDGMFLSRIKGMCIISDNQIYNANFNAGIYIRRTQDAHFKLLNNYVENTTGIAISLQDTIAATTAEIIGNKVMTASTYGIYTRSLTRLILEGNDVYGTTTGYYVLQVSRAIIVGNNSQNSTTSKTFTTISECIDANNSWNGFTAIP